MKLSILAISLVLMLGGLVSCGGNAPKPENTQVPANADLKGDITVKNAGAGNQIEVYFYYSAPVAPGDKRAPALKLLAAEEVTFNDQPLNQETDTAGQPVYRGTGLQTRRDNKIVAKLNGRTYDGISISQTTLPDKSVTVVMTPK